MAASAGAEMIVTEQFKTGERHIIRMNVGDGSTERVQTYMRCPSCGEEYTQSPHIELCRDCGLSPDLRDAYYAGLWRLK